MLDKLTTTDVNIMRIEKGHGRFATLINKKTSEGMVVFCCSDKCAPEIGVNVNLPENEMWTPVMGVALSDYRQAMAYSNAFLTLANRMRVEFEGGSI